MKPAGKPVASLPVPRTPRQAANGAAPKPSSKAHLCVWLTWPRTSMCRRGGAGPLRRTCPRFPRPASNTGQTARQASGQPRRGWGGCKRSGNGSSPRSPRSAGRFGTRGGAHARAEIGAPRKLRPQASGQRGHPSRDNLARAEGSDDAGARANRGGAGNGLSDRIGELPGPSQHHAGQEPGRDSAGRVGEVHHSLSAPGPTGSASN